jgi:hypothetical protein
LWGGIFVAIPTAMPSAPFTSMFGKAAGRTVGSSIVPSKFSWVSTVSLPMSCIICSAMRVMRASVYRIAAAESPSMEPKLPCPSASG